MNLIRTRSLKKFQHYLYLVANVQPSNLLRKFWSCRILFLRFSKVKLLSVITPMLSLLPADCYIDCSPTITLPRTCSNLLGQILSIFRIVWILKIFESRFKWNISKAFESGRGTLGVYLATTEENTQAFESILYLVLTFTWTNFRSPYWVDRDLNTDLIYALTKFQGSLMSRFENCTL